MARTTEVIVQAMLGDNALRIAALTAEVERLTEQLKAEQIGVNKDTPEAPRMAMAKKPA